MPTQHSDKTIKDQHFVPPKKALNTNGSSHQANLDATDAFIEKTEVSPEMEALFVAQVQAFEENYHQGTHKTFGETLGVPPLPPAAALIAEPTKQIEKKVQQALNFYRSKKLDVHFQFDYPPEVRYHFLVDELPTLENAFGKVPGMMIGILYEEYHPNHAGAIESTTQEFMEAIRELDAEKLRYCMAPVQFLPEGPYPTEALLAALYAKFLDIAEVNNFEYTILETSYDLKEDSETKEKMGLGYAEGLITFNVVKRNEQQHQFHGPFKFYFDYEYDMWTIIYIIFPGIKYPPIANEESGDNEEQ